MTGIADELRAAAGKVRRMQCSQETAEYFVRRGQAWLIGLGPRASSRGFAEEAAEVKEALAELREAIAAAFPKKICLLRIPARTSKTQAVQRMDLALANLGALQHADPGPLYKAGRAQLPSVAVYRWDQGWVNRRGRARVEVAYELLIGGVVACTGSKRYVMRQADWAVKCDVFGRLPEIETLTGLAKRRALYKDRKAKRAGRGARRRRGAPAWPATLTNYVTGKRKTVYLRKPPKISWSAQPAGTMTIEGNASADGSGPWIPIGPLPRRRRR